MAFLSKRYCIRVFCVTGVLFVVLLCLVAVAGTLRLAAVKNSFLDNLREQFPTYRLRTGAVFFLPPHYLLVKNIYLENSRREAGDAPSRILAALPSAVLRFSLRDYLRDKKISLSLVYLKSLQGSYQDLRRLAGVVRPLSGSPSPEKSSDLTIKLRNAQISLAGEKFEPGKGYLVNMIFHGSQRELKLMGSVSSLPLKGYFPLLAAMRGGGSNKKLTFLLSMERGTDKSRIKELTVKHPRGEGHWQGMWDGHVAELTGYSFWDVRRYDEGDGLFWENMKTSPRRLDPNLFILDVQSIMTLSPDGIRVDTLTFNANTIPVHIQGTLKTQGDPSARFSFLVQSQKLAQFFPGWTSVNGEIESHGLNSRLVSSGDVTLMAQSSAVFPRDTEIRLTLDGVRIKDREGCLGLGMEALTVRFSSGQLHLKDCDMFWNARLNQLDYLYLKGGLYDGQLAGRVWVRKTPDEQLRPYVALDLSNVRLEDSHQDWPGLAPFSGQLSGRYFARLDPKFNGRGNMLVTDGVLNRVRFLEWFSVAFGFEAMKHLRFDTLSFSSIMDETGVHLDRLSLVADRVHIRGNLSLSSQKLVSSRLSVLVDASYIEESPELAQLLKEKGQDALNYNFEFQLSGPAEAVNFQWLPSHVKDLIQQRIPDFMERRIERNIDQMIKSSP